MHPSPPLSAPLVSDGEGHKEGVEEGKTHTSLPWKVFLFFQFSFLLLDTFNGQKFMDFFCFSSFFSGWQANVTMSPLRFAGHATAYNLYFRRQGEAYLRI